MRRNTVGGFPVTVQYTVGNYHSANRNPSGAWPDGDLHRCRHNMRQRRRIAHWRAQQNLHALAFLRFHRQYISQVTAVPSRAKLTTATVTEIANTLVTLFVDPLISSDALSIRICIRGQSNSITARRVVQAYEANSLFAAVG